MKNRTTAWGWIVAVTLLVSASAPAERGSVEFGQPEADKMPWMTIITYNMGVPLNATTAFGGSFSPMGVGVDVHYMFTPSWSLAASAAWQVLWNSTDEVTENAEGNVAVQGNQYRYINSFPMLVSGNAFLSDVLPAQIVPFAGFGLGAYYMDRRVDIGVSRIDLSTWHFGIAPHAGIILTLSENIRPTVLARFHYAFSSQGTGDQPYLNINLGLSWE